MKSIQKAGRQRHPAKAGFALVDAVSPAVTKPTGNFLEARPKLNGLLLWISGALGVELRAGLARS